MTAYQNIKTRRDGGVTWITLARPPLNVLDLRTMEELSQALSEVQAEQTDTRALVIAAEGEKAFSAGVDVADHTPDRVDRMIGGFHAIFRTLEALQIPTFAAVKGLALGGGCELASGCDIVVAADNLKIGQPEIKVGVFPSIAAVVLPRLVSEKKALELILGGEVVGAEEARRIGLVSRVFPLSSFDEDFRKFLAGFAELSGPVLRAAKQAVRVARGREFEDALERVERIYLGQLMATEDAREGLDAFLAKRPPRWKHR